MTIILTLNSLSVFYEVHLRLVAYYFGAKTNI